MQRWPLCTQPSARKQPRAWAGWGTARRRRQCSCSRWCPGRPRQSQTPLSAAGVAQPLENRCGWFHNPTPNNATLTDRDGEWVVSTQGGDSAEGDWPVFTDAQWKKTNGHYGYGCACMKVVVDRSDGRVLRIASATAKPLKACREDRALPKP